MKKRFNFSRAEKIGVAVLSFIIIILLAIINTPKQSFVADIFLNDTSKVNYVEVFKNKPFNKKKTPQYSKQKINYKPFYPNSYTKSDWKKIGFTEKQSAVILKYKNQINGFNSPKDLEDCFVISKKKFNELKPYLKFKKKEEDTVETTKPEFEIINVELNGANQEQLETVHGIGPYFAKKILEYGLKLGGYCQVEQVKEVYGMTEESYLKIENQLTVNKSGIRKIDIATVNFEQLRKHPYLNWKQCQIIVSLKDKQVNDYFWSKLKDTGAFKETDIIRLKPYFK